MGHHCINCRLPGTRSAGIDGVYSDWTWSGTAFNLSTRLDVRSKQLPHQHIPVHPQTRNNPADSAHPLAPLGGDRGLCPVRTEFHGSQAGTHLPFWARASVQRNACLVTTLLPGLCCDTGGCSLLATSLWQAEG